MGAEFSDKDKADRAAAGAMLGRSVDNISQALSSPENYEAVNELLSWLSQNPRYTFKSEGKTFLKRDRIIFALAVAYTYSAKNKMRSDGGIGRDQEDYLMTLIYTLAMPVGTELENHFGELMKLNNMPPAGAA